MLGIPDSERGPLRDWSLAILGALEPVLTPEQFSRGTNAVDDFKIYLRDLVERRSREHSGDDGEILSKLIAASEFSPIEAMVERLTDLELLHNCIFILNAGHETTTNLIGNGVDLLIRNSDAMRELRDNPELIETAVGGILRLESSNQLRNRCRAAKDTVVGGRGEWKAATSISASARPTATRRSFPIPNGWTFAGRPTGILPLARVSTPAPAYRPLRMEAQVAIAKLVQRFKTIERAGDFVRGGRARFRGFLQYPLRLRATLGKHARWPHPIGPTWRMPDFPHRPDRGASASPSQPTASCSGASARPACCRSASSPRGH